MREKSISLLRELTEAHGAPGAEDAVRDIFKKNINGEIITDKMGSIYTRCKGTYDSPGIMLSAHLDEVGFVVQSLTSDGYIKFLTLGGVWGPVLLSQRVRILTDEQEIPGVVVAKPPHFLSDDERTKEMQPENMYIDVGAESVEELISKFNIQLGQTIVFDSGFAPLHHPDRFVAKAFDNRVGVGLVIQSAQEFMNLDHPNTVYCGANSQEELGGRGAHTAVHMIAPDIGIILEGIPADDLPKSEKDTHQGALGKGIQIRVLDPGTLMNRRLNQFIIEVANELNVPYQIAVRRSGGTDAKAIHLNDFGVPTAVLGIPVRYAHTANSIMDISDYLNGLKLIREIIKRLDSTICESFTQY